MTKLVEPGSITMSFERIASFEPSQGETNAVAWCPRVGFQDLIGTVGDDGSLSIWSIADDDNDAGALLDSSSQ